MEGIEKLGKFRISWKQRREECERSETIDRGSASRRGTTEDVLVGCERTTGALGTRDLNKVNPASPWLTTCLEVPGVPVQAASVPSGAPPSAAAAVAVHRSRRPP